MAVGLRRATLVGCAVLVGRALLVVGVALVGVVALIGGVALVGCAVPGEGSGGRIGVDALSNPTPSCDRGLQVGAGIYDITGPVADQGMMGYARLPQRATGLHLRQWARAFAFESGCDGARAVVVVADLQSIPQAVHQAVIARLGQRTGDRYDPAYVLLTATHTHGGPGGYFHHFLYNMTVGGFDEATFEVIVDGIVHAIERADANLAPGRLRVSEGELLGASANRSPEAYLANPTAERSRYGDDVDRRMAVLRLEDLADHPTGMLSFFGVHATSMSNTNTLVSSDNKGLAALMFERSYGGDPLAPDGFVAAFAQRAEGDVTPNVFGGDDGRGDGERFAVEASARLQAEQAEILFRSAVTDADGTISARLTYVPFDDVTVAADFADGVPRATCSAAIGLSMVGGAEDGPGFGYEGLSCSRFEADLVQDWPFVDLVCDGFANPCQGDKPILLEPGNKSPPWTPHILPIQILRIGGTVLLGVPFEVTTMSGRRLEARLRSALAAGGFDPAAAIVVSLANGYAGYLATPEEYATQHYEGASTLFGPFQLGAVEQVTSELAEAMADGLPVAPGPQPPDLSGSLVTLQAGVVFDAVPRFSGIEFGDPVDDGQPDIVQRGSRMTATMWAAHPKNDFGTMRGHFEIEHFDEFAQRWSVIAHDWDPETELHWYRPNSPRCILTGANACSQVRLEWQLPGHVPLGSYRVVYRGRYRTVDGSLVPFTGARGFDVTQ